MTGSAGQKRVPTSFLESLAIPLPSLPEQRRIAAQLEQTDRLRRTRRYALELSDSFLPAAFMEMFGDFARGPLWPFVPFGELISDGPQNGLYKPAPSYGSAPRLYALTPTKTAA